ncbi:MAG: ABC transporter ATP-binding protein [Planctomycetota bacterium]
MLLEARGVKKSYAIGDREIPVLKGVDLSIHDGEIVALLGSSGAGKSTLLHLLGLLDRPTEGDVLLASNPTAKSSVRQRARMRRAGIGFVFQFYHLIPELTALQNVLLGTMMRDSVLSWMGRRGSARARAKELLDQVGLSERQGHRPPQLSGGEKQRVAIARALISEPKVILADEPTGNLDSETAREVLELLFQINRDRGIAFLLVTHDEGVAARCDRIIRMRDGTVVDDDVPTTQAAPTGA